MSKQSSPTWSRALMIIGALCFFGGVATAGLGSVTIGAAILVAGAVLMLVSWIVLIVGVQRWRKNLEG